MTDIAPTVAPDAPADAAAVSSRRSRAIADVATTALASIARIVSDKPRSRAVPLEWPVSFEGVLYEAVTIRRLTAKEVAEFVESLKDSTTASEARLADVRCAGRRARRARRRRRVLVDEVVKGFLPHRFRGAGESA